jgi:ferric-dicitrate binding protein FerR (iron transport regulator)
MRSSPSSTNSIRLDEGSCVELDGAGKIRLRYAGGRIEFLNGEKCVGHIDMLGEDHEL